MDGKWIRQLYVVFRHSFWSSIYMRVWFFCSGSLDNRGLHFVILINYRWIECSQSNWFYPIQFNVKWKWGNSFILTKLEWLTAAYIQTLYIDLEEKFILLHKSIQQIYDTLWSWLISSGTLKIHTYIVFIILSVWFHFRRQLYADTSKIQIWYFKY